MTAGIHNLAANRQVMEPHELSLQLEHEIERVEGVARAAHLYVRFWYELQAALGDSSDLRAKAPVAFHHLKESLFSMALLRVLDLYVRENTVSLRWLAARLVARTGELDSVIGIEPRKTAALQAYILQVADRQGDVAFDGVRLARNRATAHTDPRGLGRDDGTFGFPISTLRHYIWMALLVCNEVRAVVGLNQVLNPHEPIGSDDFGIFLRLLEIGAEAMVGRQGSGWRQPLSDWDSIAELQAASGNQFPPLPPLPAPFQDPTP